MTFKKAWVLALILLASCDSDSQPAAISASPENALLLDQGELVYSVSNNGDLTPGLPVRYEPFDAPRLEEFRQAEHLDSIVAGARDEFDRILLIKDWVAAQWPKGNPDPYPPWDAITILDWIRSGVTGGFCAQYSQVMLQAYAAFGIPARYIEIGSTRNPYNHFPIEVWSNQFNKWVVMDGDFNLHFERDGIPLGALELHDAYVFSESSSVVRVLGSVRDGHPDPEEWPLGLVELYYYVRVHLKADHLTVTDEHPFDRYNDMMEWEDEFTVPWEVSEVESPYPHVELTNLRTSDRAVFEGRLNQVLVTIESSEFGLVKLNLQNNVEQFSTYQVREPGSEWRDHAADSYWWEPTSRTLEVRGINLLGVAGPTSAVRGRCASQTPTGTRDADADGDWCGASR